MPDIRHIDHVIGCSKAADALASLIGIIPFATLLCQLAIWNYSFGFFLVMAAAFVLSPVACLACLVLFLRRRRTWPRLWFGFLFAANAGFCAFVASS